MENWKWVWFTIIILIMLFSIIMEILIPTSFGTTTFFSFLPSAIIVAVVDYYWWTPILCICVTSITWLSIFYFVYNIFTKWKIKNKLLDFDDELKTLESVLLEKTSNVDGRDEYGTIKIDDKIYRVLPYEKNSTILSNKKVKIVDLKGNVCLIKEI